MGYGISYLFLLRSFRAEKAPLFPEDCIAHETVLLITAVKLASHEENISEKLSTFIINKQKPCIEN